MKESRIPGDTFSRTFSNDAVAVGGGETGQDRKLNPLGYCQRSLKIHRTANRPGALFQHVGVNHGSADIFVAQKLLNGANVVTRL